MTKLPVRDAMNVRQLWSALVPAGDPGIARVLLVAAASLGGATLLRLPFDAALEGLLPYATFFPAVLFATVLGGPWAGAIALLAGGPLALELFGSSALEFPLPSLAIWFLNGALILALAEGLRLFVNELRRREGELAVAHEQLRSVVSELSHRARNTFAVILAIVHQTARGANGVEIYRERLNERLRALASAHDLLTGDRWRHAELAAIIDAALRPFRHTAGGQIHVLAGPAVQLPASVGVSLTLALHELATNALKYGALSSTSGRAECAWTLADDGEVRLEWCERGGPRVTPPRHSGFGSQLIRQSLAGTERGHVDLEFAADGVRCVLRFASAPAEDALAGVRRPASA